MPAGLWTETRTSLPAPVSSTMADPLITRLPNRVLALPHVSLVSRAAVEREPSLLCAPFLVKPGEGPTPDSAGRLLLAGGSDHRTWGSPGEGGPGLIWGRAAFVLRPPHKQKSRREGASWGPTSWKHERHKGFEKPPERSHEYLLHRKEGKEEKVSKAVFSGFKKTRTWNAKEMLRFVYL